MRQIRLLPVAFLTSLLVIHTTFLRKTIALLLCEMMGVNPVSSYYLLHNYSKAEAAVSSSRDAVLNNDQTLEKDGQKLAACFLGICINIPNIPNGNQPKPSVSPQYNDEYQKDFDDFPHERPATDLTGTWVGTGTGFTIDQRGCTAGYTGTLTIDGQEPPKHTFTLTQNHNQLSRPDESISYNSGSSSGSYPTYFQGRISGNRIIFLANSPSVSIIDKSVGTVNNTGDTITGTVYCKTARGSAIAQASFTLKKQTAAQCSRFQTMLSEAKDIQKLADKLEKDDKAYHNAVIDIILRGYNAPYAVYILNVPSEQIPALFRDEAQIRAVRSQLIQHIRTKAENRERFAEFGINGNFHTNGDIYSKENIELFCTLDSSKFTKEFWDSLWMAGYIDYDLYTQVENKLIVYGYKGYFETLANAATLFVPIERPFLYIARYSSGVLKGLSLTKLQVKFIDLLKSRKLPITEKLGLVSSAEAVAAKSLTALTRATLPAGEVFATREGIWAAAEETSIVSAEEANAAIISKFGGKPPFLEGTKVTRYKVGEKGLTLIRFWGNESKETGAYFTFESEAVTAKSDIAALRDALALPPGNTMEHVSVVRLKPGAEIEVGYVRGNFEDANGVALSGGGMQVRIMNDYTKFAEFKEIQ